jgi:8-oxo-dGTP pyrophosphatase MutT (NUDIX family)
MTFAHKQLLQTSRFTVYCDTTVQADGKIQEHYYVEKPDAVAVLAHTPSALLFLRVKRYLIGESSYELPGGRVEEGESPDNAARRELWEETRLVASELRLLGSVFPLPSVATEQVHIYATTITEDALTVVADAATEGIESQQLVPFGELPSFVSANVRSSISGYAALLFLSRFAP